MRSDGLLDTHNMPSIRRPVAATGNSDIPALQRLMIGMQALTRYMEAVHELIVQYWTGYFRNMYNSRLVIFSGQSLSALDDPASFPCAKVPLTDILKHFR